MRKLVLSLFALVLLLGACGGKEKEEDPEETGILPIDKEERVTSDETVLTVNDEDVLGNVYNLIYVQTKIQMYNYGEDYEDLENVKDLSLNTLVEQELLRQRAIEQGIKITEEDVESKYNELMEDSEEEVHEFLEVYNLEVDAFKEQISFSLYLDEYMDKAVSVEVSEEDLVKTYEELSEQFKDQEEEIPEFDEIKEQLKEEMTHQKRQEQVLDTISQMKEEAKIEIHI